MPEADPWSLEIINTYKRCRERNSLPCAGGVLDQPEALMRWFDVIDEIQHEIKQKMREDAEHASNIARLKAADGLH